MTTGTQHSPVGGLISAGAAVVSGTSQSAAMAAGGNQEAAVKKGGAGALPWNRKKKKEEVAMPLRPGGAQREKSIMQQAQEQFQGLCRSADGRKILELGTRHQ